MGDRPITDDHAADLSHVREVRDVVDSLRRLLVAAAQADEAALHADDVGRTPLLGSALP